MHGVAGKRDHDAGFDAVPKLTFELRLGVPTR